MEQGGSSDTRVAIVFVDVNWFNATFRHLVHAPPSDANAVQMLEGGVRSIDHDGVWMGAVESPAFVDRRTGEPVTTVLDVLVPWRYVVSVALERDQTTPPPDRPIGFRVDLPDTQLTATQKPVAPAAAKSR